MRFFLFNTVRLYSTDNFINHFCLGIILFLTQVWWKVFVHPNSTVPFFIYGNHGLGDFKSSKPIEKTFEANQTLFKQVYGWCCWYFMNMIKLLRAILIKNFNFNCLRCHRMIFFYRDIEGFCDWEICNTSPLIDLEVIKKLDPRDCNGEDSNTYLGTWMVKETIFR